MSVRTELAGIQTVLGDVDLDRAVATFTILSRFKVFKTSYNTQYNTVTQRIVSRVVTAVLRTYTLRYGDVNTRFVTRIPTNLLVTVYTVVEGEVGKEKAATPSGQPTAISRGTPIPV